MTDSSRDDQAYIEPEPPHDEEPRGGASTRIIALAALGVVIVLIAVGAGAFRDRIASVLGPTPPVREVEERRALEQRIDQLQSELDLARRQAAQTRTPAPAADLTDPTVFEERIAAIEAAQSRMSRAAAAAVAAGALADAAEGAEPFAGELAALERLSPTSRGVRALRELAEQGAPTRAALAAEFPVVAARAARAARGREESSGFFGSLNRALNSVFSLRRIGSLEGDSPDAVLARAERQVQAGDLEGALAQLQSLPEPARTTIVEWTAKAERRVEIERRIAALRAQALGDLAGAAAAETGGPL